MTEAFNAALAKQAAAAVRKAKRKEKGEALGLRPKKVKRKKSPSMSKLKELLWEEMRQVVYAQSPDRCLTCGSDAPPVACHIVPSSDAAATKFFLANLYRGCRSCNDAERHRRGQWVKRHEEVFGVDLVNALYAFSETTFQLKKWWILEQTERMRKLRGING